MGRSEIKALLAFSVASFSSVRAALAPSVTAPRTLRMRGVTDLRDVEAGGEQRFIEVIVFLDLREHHVVDLDAGANESAVHEDDFAACFDLRTVDWRMMVTG